MKKKNERKQTDYFKTSRLNETDSNKVTNDTRDRAIWTKQKIINCQAKYFFNDKIANHCLKVILYLSAFQT